MKYLNGNFWKTLTTFMAIVLVGILGVILIGFYFG